jgi:hypothetical protein
MLKCRGYASEKLILRFRANTLLEVITIGPGKLLAFVVDEVRVEFQLVVANLVSSLDGLGGRVPHGLIARSNDRELSVTRKFRDQVDVKRPADHIHLRG